MFAGAAREVVFSNREVVRRINKQFIPVALKAAMINNPPRGIEGALYAEIGRSKPAPQGICTVNSDGKVLTWALTFDDDASILKFLDHVVKRYKTSPDASEEVAAQRFMRFPSRQLADVADTKRLIEIPKQHAHDDRCPGLPAVERGTLVGRIIGRPLDDDGKPIAETLRQEDYMEARLEIPPLPQLQLARAVRQSDGKRFKIPDAFARSLISPAHLGQLDANPLGDVPGSQNDSRHWEFTGRKIESDNKKVTRIRIDGESDVKGGQDVRRKPKGEDRIWEHRVALRWQGYVDITAGKVVRLVMLAEGTEDFRWGNERFKFLGPNAATHLMAGHPIDLHSAVRYGIVAEPSSPEEVVDGTEAKTGSPGPGASSDCHQAV